MAALPCELVGGDWLETFHSTPEHAILSICSHDFVQTVAAQLRELVGGDWLRISHSAPEHATLSTWSHDFVQTMAAQLRDLVGGDWPENLQHHVWACKHKHFLS